MCHHISWLFYAANKIGDVADLPYSIRIGDGLSHSQTMFDHMISAAADVAEAEWEDDDCSPFIRHPVIRVQRYLKKLTLERWPTKQDFIAWLVQVYGSRITAANATYTFDSKYYLHSYDDQPAAHYIQSNGGGQLCTQWFKHGRLHREGGPAQIEVCRSCTRLYYFKDGKAHREDGPATLYIDRVTNKETPHAWAFNGSFYHEEKDWEERKANCVHLQ
jgi:hypothetical protein